MSRPIYALDFFTTPSSTATAPEPTMTSLSQATEFFPSCAPAAAATPRWTLKAVSTFLALTVFVLPLMLLASLSGAGRHRD